jgi:hypothetical protein
MKPVSLILIFSVFITGCKNDIDTTAPKPPQGIRTVSLDGQVEISWLPSQDDDVQGYNIWLSYTYNGVYSLIGTTSETRFIHYNADNGVTYFYAVSAFDFSKNESELSTDMVYDTPRPEGYGTRLYDYHIYPDSSGYDFSAYSITSYDYAFVDLYLDNHSGINYIVVNDDTGIQDMGYTYTIDDISSSPTDGWALSGYVEAITGHTYVIRTYNNHYAKIRITDEIGGSIIFDWAYQTAQWNTELKKVRMPEQTAETGNGYIHN